MSQGDDVSGWHLNPNISIVRVILHVGAIIISFASILLGIRRMRKLGRNFQHGFMVIIGVSTCILFFILNFYVNNKMSQMYRGFFETNIIGKLEKKLMESDLTLNQRIFVEKQLAKEIYVSQNRLISITDENGNHSLFKPSDENIAYKKSHDYLRNWILKIKIAKKNGMILWIAVLVFGILLGRYLPIQKSNKPNS